MNLSENQKKALNHYEQHYTIVFDSSLREERPVRLADHEDVSGRVCRFCGKGKPDVTFKSIAHAVPEFLGNKSLISMNECDDCNQCFARQYEDDLAKWFGPMRTVSQIRGKSGVPTYKNNDMRIEMDESGLKIGVVAEDLESHLKFDGPFTFTLPVPAKTQPHIRSGKIRPSLSGTVVVGWDTTPSIAGSCWWRVKPAYASPATNAVHACMTFAITLQSRPCFSGIAPTRMSKHACLS